MDNKSKTSRRRTVQVDKFNALATLKSYIDKKEIPEEDSVDRFVYGIDVTVLDLTLKQTKSVIMLDDKDNKVIKYIDIKEKIAMKINMSTLSEISYGNNRGNFLKLTQKVKDQFSPQFCMSLFCEKISTDLIFKSLQEIDAFSKGLYTIWEGQLSEDAKKYLNLKLVELRDLT